MRPHPAAPASEPPLQRIREPARAARRHPWVIGYQISAFRKTRYASGIANAETLQLHPIPGRKNLVEEVADRLLKALEGLEPGTRLPSERELSVALGVGKSSVREALKGLAMLGIIEIRHGQGAFVLERPSSRTQPPHAIAQALAKGHTQDLVEARRLIDGSIARLAAERRSDSDLAELRNTLASHRRALHEHDDPTLAAAKFHIDLAEAAQNEILASFAVTLSEPERERLGDLYALDPGFPDWEIAQHEAILAAVAGADPDLAEQLAQRHVDAMAEHYRRSGV
jgi:GntR family transcriptional repressor for pyruvate dehydrogenase complex